MDESFYTYRRHLPHWRQEGSVYFVTWRLAGEQSLLTPPERTIIVEALRHFHKQRYELFAYVIMDDHVHVLAQPIAPHELRNVLHTWKSYSARCLQKQFGRQGALWQNESFDRIVRDEQEFQEKARYILHNPLKRWPDLIEYEWVGIGAWHGQAGTPVLP